MVIRVSKELGTGGDYSKQTFLSIAIGKIMRPFHRQAKGRPVAEPLSRAMSCVDLVFIFFVESTPLTKNPQHAHWRLVGKNGRVGSHLSRTWLN